MPALSHSANSTTYHHVCSGAGVGLVWVREDGPATEFALPRHLVFFPTLWTDEVENRCPPQWLHAGILKPVLMTVTLESHSRI